MLILSPLTLSVAVFFSITSFLFFSLDNILSTLNELCIIITFYMLSVAVNIVLQNIFNFKCSVIKS